MNESSTCVLPDGRTPGYAIFGDDAGIPVSSFHGWRGSRLEAAGFAGPAAFSSPPGVRFPDGVDLAVPQTVRELA